MKATSVQKTLVLLAVLAVAVNACSCYKFENEYDVTFYSEADGYDASYFPEEADAGSASSEGSDTYSSTGQSHDEDGYDEEPYEEEVPVLRAPAVRQLKKLVAGQKGGVNQKKCNDACAKLQDESLRVCCPLWCRWSSDQAKKIKAKGRDAAGVNGVKEGSWTAIEKANKGEGDLNANPFIKFTKGPTCLDYLNKPLPPLPEKRGRPVARRPRVTPRRNPSPKPRSASPARK